MAPSRTATKKNPKFRKPNSTASSSGGTSSKAPSSRSKVAKRAPAKQVKTKPGAHSNTLQQRGKPSARKQKTYSAKELDLPALNMITPVTAPENPTNLAKRGGTGKKKNKIYIDDVDEMRTILAMVTAEKEGQIESKLIKARQLEEVREARRREMEKRREGKAEALEGVKKELKKGKKTKGGDEPGEAVKGKEDKKRSKKKVSFA